MVLAAADGCGLAAEVLAAAAGAPSTRLVVLDGADPVRAADALAGDLDATALVVAAPPGADTAVVSLLWDTAAEALRDEGIDPAAHTVVVTPPDGPLRARAEDEGATVVLGEPAVAGPWAALTAYALVPAGLAGADVETVLVDAAEAPAGPGPLGARLADAASVALADDGSGVAEWAATLLAAAGGPPAVAVEEPGAPGWAEAPLAVTFGAGGGADGEVVDGPVAAQIVRWQHAVAAAVPDERAPRPTGSYEAPVRPEDGTGFVEGGVEVSAGDWLPPGTDTVVGALRALVDDAGHVALHAYLDRHGDASFAVLRPELARRTGRAATFGWAPRCLPREVPPGTAVCQVTGGAAAGATGRAAELAALQDAGARADAAALAARGHRVLRLHLPDRVAGLVAVARAVQDLSRCADDGWG